ncbi:uncharacterized protein LOC127283809 [Leptopilina boulardi]|uniref:uncharacterized protein LOC127283809 n=1 Tax=Leptopilina boulardi TaxID=63433 RepID=UPI0021F5745E|nr:uncharacterized protein LOC127283809 [Leptopilina boulardi]
MGNPLREEVQEQHSPCGYKIVGEVTERERPTHRKRERRTIREREKDGEQEEDAKWTTYQEVGTCIKSKRGHRLSPRAISDLEELRSLLRLRVQCSCCLCNYKSWHVLQAPVLTMSSKGAFYLLLIALIFNISLASTKYYVKLRDNPSDAFKTKNPYDLRVLHYPLSGGRVSLQDDIGARIQDEDQSASKDFGPKLERRHSFEESATFNPDVLNKFLEEYASKIKSTTERNYKYPFRVMSEEKPTNFGINIDGPLEKEIISSETVVNLNSSQGHFSDLNDTSKRNSYWSGSNSHDDRNGWVTLDAVPWSKSKISKWQANNPTSQRPWPDAKPWDKPNTGKPWQSDYTSRPTYENNKPWLKPNWQEQSGEKPWLLDRPKPSQSMRPIIDRYEENPEQAQTWPPENKPSWNRYPDKYRPTGDIITDERPSNFPNSWDRPQLTKPSYTFPDRYTIKNEDETGNWKTQNYNDRYDKYRPSDSNDRPNFSQYQYLNDRPSSHPSSGDGEWILLSTNRGYSKSRQRSIKIDSIKPESLTIVNGTKIQNNSKMDDNDPPVPVLTSRRQVRLTVLPSVNGTNTTTSHGGLLEVERTFKTVDQSQKEYENNRKSKLQQTLMKRPIRNTIYNGNPSNSAILAAVGAGMLPATMAMMIPMMLGRKKRDIQNSHLEHTLTKAFYLDQGLRHLMDKHNDQRTKLLRF